MKLAVIASHPIQYHAPLYRRLAGTSGITLSVFFANKPDAQRQGRGFGQAFEWDIPLTAGYPSAVFAQNLDRPRDWRGMLRGAAHLRRMWKADPPDLIFLTGWHHPGMVAGLIAARASGKPLIFRGEATLSARRGAAKRAAHRLLLAQFQRILFIGEANRKYYLAHGVNPGRLVFSPFFSENERIGGQADELAGRRQEIRAGWGIPENATCFLFCGKLEPKKRVEDFIAAIGQCPGAHALVVGSGELEAALRQQSDRRISFAGFLNQSRIAEAYCASDVLVLPSDEGEVWGVVVNEAMACGLPAVVSDRVGCREDLIKEGETGFSFPFGNIGALAATLRRFVATPGLAKQMGSCARAHIQSYSVENAAAGVMRAVQAVCGGRS